ncbi:sulfate/molybdate ABC transporter ATP-binding protein [Selenomonas ruminantium]|uniref:sulfate/molybdate ABC transporter ATP-binding protein n=1 Tax=Selenomonas ruminantium TaxID=971 RepID=UPI00156A6C31|nr:ATP-binding cassette domain-containing protein [Selenomonas ruminantium]
MELIVSLEKKLPAFTLKADFTLKDEVFALLGASGCGKSMTLKCIAGIERPDKGHIVLDGKVLFDSEQQINLPPQKRQIGYLFQHYALFPNMTIAENIRFVMPPNTAHNDKTIQKLLNTFQLTDLADTYPAALSGGQQQRAALARILATPAKILLLDEPFSALDSYLKGQMETELMDILPAYGRTAILVSHDRGEVYRLADKAAVINQGKMETPQNTKDLFHNPQTLAATLLTGCKNISRAQRIDDRHIYALDWDLPLKTVAEPSSQIKYTAIRAHFLTAQEKTAGENVFPMEVVRVIEDTFSYIVMVRPQGKAVKPLRWELDKQQWQQLKKTTLYLYLPPEQIMMMNS